jgi:hypothetical protein
MAANALNVWTAPELPSEILAAYRPKAAEAATYSIEDHPHLLTG